MAKRSLPRPKRGSHQPISYHPGKGLLVSTHARFPETVDDKIVCAKSIVQAVVAAHDAEQDMGNYDIHWPLSLAAEILEQAADQFSKEGVSPAALGKFTDDDADRTPLPGLPPALPCPFCGDSEDIQIVETAPPKSDSDGFYRVTCGRCAVDAPGGPTPLEAAEEWNKRPADRQREWGEDSVEQEPREARP